MKFRFLPQARREFLEAAQHYDRIKPGLGLRYVSCVEDAIGKIVTSPRAWPIITGDVRRCLTKVFPYSILYAVRGDEVVIVAVMHCHRRPDYWLGRID